MVIGGLWVLLGLTGSPRMAPEISQDFLCWTFGPDVGHDSGVGALDAHRITQGPAWLLRLLLQHLVDTSGNVASRPRAPRYGKPPGIRRWDKHLGDGCQVATRNLGLRNPTHHA